MQASVYRSASGLARSGWDYRLRAATSSLTGCMPRDALHSVTLGFRLLGIEESTTRSPQGRATQIQQPPARTLAKPCPHTPGSQTNAESTDHQESSRSAAATSVDTPRLR